MTFLHIRCNGFLHRGVGTDMTSIDYIAMAWLSDFSENET
jgi:hypothetical protein